MQPVTASLILVILRVVVDCLSGEVIKSVFIKVVSGIPFEAGEIAVPVNLIDNIIFEWFIAYLGGIHPFMG